MRVGGPITTDIPKADLHMHAETRARIDRLLATRNDEPAHDWADELKRLEDHPPGMPRLERAFSVLASPLDNERLDALNSEEAIFVEWLTEALRKAAADGAILIEVRFGAKWGMRPGFMSLFREAEDCVRVSYPNFHAEALVTSLWPSRPGATEAFEDSLCAAREGLAGIDFIPVPYDEEADWTDAYAWARRAADAGLGITAHLGEFSSANIEAGLGLPGLTRLGHAVYTAADDGLLDQVLKAGVTVECCLTSNVVLGAVPSLEQHPITEMAAAGVLVTLASDNPVRTCTTIGREYELAAGLGFGPQELHAMTAQGIGASFTSDERKAALRDLVRTRTVHLASVSRSLRRHSLPRHVRDRWARAPLPVPARPHRSSR